MMAVPKLRFKEFSEKWNTQTLSEVVDVIDCKHRTPNYVEDGVPVVSPGTIKWGEIDLISQTKRVTSEDYESLMDHCTPKKGDLVFSRNQSVGIASFILNDTKFVLGQDTVLIQAKGINSKFNYHVLQAGYVQRQIAKLSGGSTFSRINLGEIRKLKIRVTPNEKEQQKIASFLSAVDEKIQQLTRKKELLEQYKKGVMQQLFSGKLRFKDENSKPYPKWEEKRLGDIAKITIGEFVIKSKQTPDGKYPVYNGGSSWTGHYNEYNNEGNKIIISARGANAGFVNYEVRKYWAGNSCYSVDIIDKSLNIVLFIYYYVKFKQNLFTDFQQAANIPSVSKKDAMTFNVICPSTEEQQKIASFLTALDAKIESVATQIAHTQTFKKGLLQQMFV